MLSQIEPNRKNYEAMDKACEQFGELQELLSMRADALNYLRNQFSKRPDLKCTADIFWATNQSYNAQIMATIKKIIEEDSNAIH